MFKIKHFYWLLLAGTNQHPTGFALSEKNKKQRVKDEGLLLALVIRRGLLCVVVWEKHADEAPVLWFCSETLLWSFIFTRNDCPE